MIRAEQFPGPPRATWLIEAPLLPLYRPTTTALLNVLRGPLNVT